jgi:vanillate O-demethylase monooxygenase subunit
VVERHSMIWIWMGDASLADAATIPDYSCNDPEDHHVLGDYLEMACDYRFATDNILDLSHIEFAHRDSLAPAFEGAIEQESAVRREGGDVWSDRCYIGIPARSGADGLAIDHWLNVRWTAPAAMLLCTGKATHGAPRQDPDEGRHTHAFTPISATRSHYWFGVSRPTGRASIEQVEVELDRLRGPFREEDLPMLAAQQEAFGDEDFWKARPVMLAGDAGALRARRVLDQMIREQELSVTNGRPEARVTE